MRAFDDYLMAALGQKVTNLALCVRIVRRDGTRILFAQASEAITTLDETGAAQTFSPARGVTVATIPFELNGATSRCDLNIISTDGGTIDVADIENGLYDNAAVTISLADRSVPPQIQPVIVTEAGGLIIFPINPPSDGSAAVTINGVTLIFANAASPGHILVGGSAFITAQHLAAYLAASLDQRLLLANYSALSAFPTYPVVNIVALWFGPDGNLFTLAANPASGCIPTGAYPYNPSPTLTGGAGIPIQASGTIAFPGNPPSDGSWQLTVNGVTLAFSNTVGPFNIPVGGSVSATANNLENYLNASTDQRLILAGYFASLIGSGFTINIIAVTPGSAGNNFTLAANVASGATVSGPTLTRGTDAGNPPPPQNVLFDGLMSTMTLTERGYATIEMVGLLERAKQFVTEVFTPVCRADFGDARCKVNLNGVDALGNLITQHCKVTGYDGGYKITVSGLNNVAVNAFGARASGTIRFTVNPPAFATVPGQQTPIIYLNGTGLSLWDITTPTDAAYGQVGASVIAETLEGTLGNLLNFLTTSKDPNLALMAYNVDLTTLYVTAAAEGTGGNVLTLAIGSGTPATASGPTLAGGIGSGLAVGNYFLNGQVIFRSGLLLNEAYEIQASEGNVISLFTPLEFPPEYGDMIDILQGCDHSPFAGGCARFPDPATGLAPNIANYRGEPWAPGDAINPCQAAPAALPITGVPQPVGPGEGGPPSDNEPSGLWADFVGITAG